MRIVAYTVVACSLAISGGFVRAQSTEPVDPFAAKPGSTEAKLAELRETLLYARFSEAKPELEKLAKDSSLSARNRAVALELLAQLYIALGDDRSAIETLKQLYSRDPEFSIKDTNVSPKVRATFDKVRAANISPITPQMENIVPTRERLRQQPLVKVRVIKHLDAVHELYVYYRQGDRREYVRLAMVPDPEGVAQALIPPINTEDEYNIEFYVEAVAPSGAKLGRMGTAETPLRVTVPAARQCTDASDPACRCDFYPKSKGCPFCFENPDDPACADDPCVRDPGGEECKCIRNPQASGCSEESDSGTVFEEWWFWTIVGVAVAGGAVAGVILLTPTDDPLDGSLDSATLQRRN